jgi:hypothetical protein
VVDSPAFHGAGSTAVQFSTTVEKAVEIPGLSPLGSCKQLQMSGLVSDFRLGRLAVDRDFRPESAW